MRSLGLFWWAAGLAVVLTGPARAQSSLSGYDLLLQNEGVQKELKLTDEQRTKVREVIHGVRQKHKEDLEKLADLSQDEKRDKAQAILNTISHETLKSVNGTLKPEQTKRLKQIRLQFKGIQAFLEADVGKVLKLTDEQKDKVKAIEDDVREEWRKASQGPGRTNLQTALKKVASLRKEALDKAVAILTPEQKKTWKELAGEPYELQFDGPLFRKPGSEREKK